MLLTITMVAGSTFAFAGLWWGILELWQRLDPAVTWSKPTPMRQQMDSNLSDPMQPWTPAEREAFGINALDAWIRETDKALATPLERTMMATAEDIAAAAAVPPPIIGKPGPRVWEQTEEGFQVIM